MQNSYFTSGDYKYTKITIGAVDMFDVPYGVTRSNYFAGVPITDEEEWIPHIYVTIWDGVDEAEGYFYYGKSESGTLRGVNYSYDGNRNMSFTNYSGEGTVSISISYEYCDSNTVKVSVIDKTKTSYSAIPTTVINGGVTYTVTSMEECFQGCTNMTASPTIPTTNITSLRSCFSGCSSLSSAPSIPSTITDVSQCFAYCTSLTGNINVNNVPTNEVSNYTNPFVGLRDDVYIIDGTGSTASAAAWRALCALSTYAHYEADDVPNPSLTFPTFQRVDSTSGSIDPDGQSVKIEARVSQTLSGLPIGWGISITSQSVTVDSGSTDIITTWTSSSGPTKTGINNKYNLGDPNQHSFKISATVVVTNGNNIVKKTINAERSEILAAVFATIDFYPGGKGVAIGAYAKSEGFTLEMDTMINKKAGVYVDPNAASGTEDRKLQTSITNLSWGSILANAYLDIKKSLSKIIQTLDTLVNDPWIVERGSDLDVFGDGNCYWRWYKYRDGSYDLYCRSEGSFTKYATSNGFLSYYKDVEFPSACKPYNEMYYVNQQFVIGSGHAIASTYMKLPGTARTLLDGFRAYSISTTPADSWNEAEGVLLIHVHGTWKQVIENPYDYDVEFPF